jgi:aryl-alcohol dehydrogenase-like predicted oxidoreductase
MGKTELEMSEIGFGALTSGCGRWGNFTDDYAVGLLREVQGARINCYVASPTNGQGRGKGLLGKAFTEKREFVVLSTKAGLSDGIQNVPPAGVRKLVDENLARLKSLCIGALQIHHPDAGAVADPALWQTLGDLRMEGETRHGIALGPGLGCLAEGRIAMRRYDLALTQVYHELLQEEPGRKFFPVALVIKQSMTIRVPNAGGVFEADPASSKWFSADGDFQVKYASRIAVAEGRATNLKWIYKRQGMSMKQTAVKFDLSEETIASVIPDIYIDDKLDTYTAVSDLENFSQSELTELAEEYRKGFGVA